MEKVLTPRFTPLTFSVPYGKPGLIGLSARARETAQNKVVRRRKDEETMFRGATKGMKKDRYNLY